VTFSGTGATASKSQPEVTLYVYPPNGIGSPIEQIPTTVDDEGNFTATTTTPLPSGSYLVFAEQYSLYHVPGISSPYTITVDATPPKLFLTGPANGSTTSSSPAFVGLAGTADGDQPAVTVDVYSGARATGTPVQTLSATSTDSTGDFSVPASSPLAPGTYTAVATQLDAMGNLGTSNKATFTVPGPMPTTTTTTTPAPTPQPTTTPGGGSPTVPASLAFVGSPSGQSGHVKMTLACRGASGPCSFTVAVTTVEQMSGKRVTAINARASKHQTRQLNVASRRLSVRAGKRVTVTLLPSRAALALLTKFGRLPVQVRVTLASSKQTLNRSLVVRPANRKSRRV
jgi:hypothetical protein